jgi:N-acetylmuramoyl-L-alanine amidase
MRKVNFIVIHCTAFLANILESGYNETAFLNYLNNYLYRGAPSARKVELVKKWMNSGISFDSGDKFAQYMWKEIIGWSNPGYKSITLWSGQNTDLAKYDQVTNGVKGYNSQSIHLAYDGGVRWVNGRFVEEDTRSMAQKSSLEAQIIEALTLLEKTQDFMPEIVGHNFLDKGKSCPCFDARKEYRYLL